MLLRYNSHSSSMGRKITPLLLIFSGFCIVCTQSVNYRDVAIAQGVVRGYWHPEQNVFAFESIPYATVPTGRDFYTAPLPAPTWNRTFIADDKKIVCRQPVTGIIPGDFTMQEQCLIVNIYTPKTITAKIPVVVIVHGGAYLFGHGNNFKPTHLVQSGKVIAVTFNYRLGPHGFLCLGTKTAPGNAGMKDQVALLRWVQNNIDKFGGNPNDVTISGCSAGSSSVDLLLISKITKGLFHKVIAGSGSNSNAFSVQIDPLENAKEFAEQLGFNNTNDLEALEIFYLEQPYDTLANYSFKLSERPDSVVIFSPCLENDIGQEIFLNESPVKTLKSKNFRKLPMLYGFCNMEGLFRAGFFDTWKIQMNERFIDFLPPDLGYSIKERQILANDIKNFYFGDEPVSDANILGYIDFFTDVLFSYGMLRSAKLQLEAGNNEIYLYEYSFVDKSVDYIRNTSLRGARHCSQEFAVLDLPNENELSQEYQHMKKVMRDLWLNFITTGAPVPLNPNDVTISGCSAGSSSVDLLLISKITKGLFHKVIAGSGSNSNAFSVQIDPLENAKEFAEQLGFNNTNDLEALEIFYLEQPYDTLANYSFKLSERPDSVVIFSPCLENDIGQEIFLNESPVKTLKSKNFRKLPMLYGFCNMEGLFRAGFFDTWKIQMNERFIDFLPPDLGYSIKERQILANDIKNFYFGDEPVSDANILGYIDFFTDVLFSYGMLRSAKLQLEAGNNEIYLYEYSFVDKSVDYIRNTSLRGARHCSQEFAVLDLPNENELSQEYQHMKKVMRDLWLNFITTGAPVPQESSYPAWLPMSLQRSYMSLNSTLEYRDSLLTDRFQFWDELNKDYYKYPTPPRTINAGFLLGCNIYILCLIIIFNCVTY